MVTNPVRTVTVLWEAHARAGAESELKALLTGIASSPPEHSNIQAYEVQTKAGSFIIIERWDNRDALDEHLASARMQALGPQLGRLLDTSVAHEHRFIEQLH
jgi:quinol monooxygenase YgiN